MCVAPLLRVDRATWNTTRTSGGWSWPVLRNPLTSGGADWRPAAVWSGWFFLSCGGVPCVLVLSRSCLFVGCVLGMGRCGMWVGRVRGGVGRRWEIRLAGWRCCGFVAAGVSFVVARGRGCGVAGGGRCCVGGAGGIVPCCCGWRVGAVGVLVCGAVVLPCVGCSSGGAVAGGAGGWVLSGWPCCGSRVASLRRAAPFFGDHRVSPRQITVK